MPERIRTELSKILSLLSPSEFVESICDVDIAQLRNRNITALLIDLDNTLVAWQRYNIAKDVIDWVNSAIEFGIKVCIVSNTRTPRRLERLANELGVPFTKKALKPRRRGFREGLNILNVDASQTAVIGDQIFTDILGGNRLGLYTILVRPISGREFIGTKLSRVLEAILLGYWKRKGILYDQDTKSDESMEQSD